MKIFFIVLVMVCLFESKVESKLFCEAFQENDYKIDYSLEYQVQGGHPTNNRRLLLVIGNDYWLLTHSYNRPNYPFVSEESRSHDELGRNYSGTFLRDIENSGKVNVIGFILKNGSKIEWKKLKVFSTGCQYTDCFEIERTDTYANLELPNGFKLSGATYVFVAPGSRKKFIAFIDQKQHPNNPEMYTRRYLVKHAPGHLNLSSNVQYDGTFNRSNLIIGAMASLWQQWETPPVFYSQKGDIFYRKMKRFDQWSHGPDPDGIRIMDLTSKENFQKIVTIINCPFVETTKTTVETTVKSTEPKTSKITTVQETTVDTKPEPSSDLWMLIVAVILFVVIISVFIIFVYIAWTKLTAKRKAVPISSTTSPTVRSSAKSSVETVSTQSGNTQKSKSPKVKGKKQKK